MMKIILKNSIGYKHVSYIAVIEPEELTSHIITELKRYGLMLKMYMTDKIDNNDHVLVTLDLQPKKSTFLNTHTLHTVVFATPEYFIYQGLGESVLNSCLKDIDSYDLFTIPLTNLSIQQGWTTKSEILKIRSNVGRLIPMDKDKILIKRVTTIIQNPALIPGAINSAPTLSFLPAQAAILNLPKLPLAAVNNKLGITNPDNETTYTSKYVDGGSFDKIALTTSEHFIPLILRLDSAEVKDILTVLKTCASRYKELLNQTDMIYKRNDAKSYEKNLDLTNNLWNTFQNDIYSNLLSILDKKINNNLNNSNVPPDKIVANLLSEVSTQLEKAHKDAVEESHLIQNIKNNFIHSFELVTLDIWTKLINLESDITKTSRLAALDTFLDDFEASIHFKNDIYKSLRRQEAFLHNPAVTAGYENNEDAYIAFSRDYQSLNLDRTERNFNRAREELPENIQTYRAEYRAAVLEKFKEFNNTPPVPKPESKSAAKSDEKSDAKSDEKLNRKPNIAPTVTVPTAPDPNREINFPYFTFKDGKFAWDECVANAHKRDKSTIIVSELAQKIDDFITNGRKEIAECKQLAEKFNTYKSAAENAVIALGAITDSVAILNNKFATVKAKYEACVAEAAALDLSFSHIKNLNIKSARPAEKAVQELKRRLNAYGNQLKTIQSGIYNVRTAKDMAALRQEESAVERELNNHCEVNFRNQLNMANNTVIEFQHGTLLKDFLLQIKTAAQNVEHWNNHTTKFLCIGGTRVAGQKLRVPKVIAETINLFNGKDISSLSLTEVKVLVRQLQTSAKDSAARRDKRFFQIQKEATLQWNKLIMQIEPSKFGAGACTLEEALARNEKLAEGLASIMEIQPVGKVTPAVKPATSTASVTRVQEPSVSIAPRASF